MAKPLNSNSCGFFFLCRLSHYMFLILLNWCVDAINTFQYTSSVFVSQWQNPNVILQFVQSFSSFAALFLEQEQCLAKLYAFMWINHWCACAEDHYAKSHLHSHLLTANFSFTSSLCHILLNFTRKLTTLQTTIVIKFEKNKFNGKISFDKFFEKKIINENFELCTVLSASRKK